jgi:hypothetical protein
MKGAAAARKQELCSKNKAIVNGIKKPRTQNVPDSEDDADFDRTLVYCECSDVTAVDGYAECFFSTSNYSEDYLGEQWVQCFKCCRWAREYSGAQDPQFVCSTCEAPNK